MVEMEADKTKRIQKSPMVKLSVSEEDVELFEHSLEFVSHNFSKSSRVPFCANSRIPSEKSFAKGDPLWNTCGFISNMLSAMQENQSNV